MEQTNSQPPKDAASGASTTKESYSTKPSLEDKFKEGPVKEILRDVVGRVLTGKSYNEVTAKRWTVIIAKEVNERVKLLKMHRYKHVVHVVLGELGAGVKSGVKQVWDPESDCFTSEIFMNDTIFCVTTVFAIYMY